MTDDKHRSGWAEDVREFHRTAEQPVRDRPEQPRSAENLLRRTLVIEELAEFDYAMRTLYYATKGTLPDRLADVDDAIADSIYVLIGTAVQLGLPMGEIWRRVHRSNMAKVEGGLRLRHDGKVLKPPGWQPPDVVGAIRDAMEGRR